MAKKKNINYDMFSITPSEGKIASLEGKIFTVVYVYFFFAFYHKIKCSITLIPNKISDFLCKLLTFILFTFLYVIMILYLEPRLYMVYLN